MKTINFTNSNGNVAVKVRDGIRAQVLAKALEVLGASFDGTDKNANGGISFPIAIDGKSGETVYAHLDLTVSMRDPSVKIERKKSTAKPKAEEVVVPTLFE